MQSSWGTMVCAHIRVKTQCATLMSARRTSSITMTAMQRSPQPGDRWGTLVTLPCSGYSAECAL